MLSSLCVTGNCKKYQDLHVQQFEFTSQLSFILQQYAVIQPPLPQHRAAWLLQLYKTLTNYFTAQDD